MKRPAIAFCGASGTGKSTLANALAHHWGVEICPVGSRQVAADLGFPNPYDVDAAGKRAEFQQLLLKTKREWELERLREDDGGLVTDRTHIDNLVYTCMHDALGADPDFRHEIANAMQIYSDVLFCPMASFFDIASDPMRVPERAYHEKYERLLLSFLPEFIATHTKVHIITARNREDRISQTLRLVA